MLRLSTFLVLVFSIYSLVYTQPEQMMVDISEQLEQLVEQYVNESSLKHEFPQDVNDIRFIFSPKEIDSLQLEHIQQEQLAEMEVIRKDKGLRLQSSYGNNFRGSILEDDGTFYLWRANAGLDWNLLNGGLINRKQQLKQKLLQFEADQAKQVDEIRELSYRKSFDHIIYTFNKQKISVIEARLHLLSELLSVVEKMYYLRYTHWEAVLDVKSKKAETELFLHNYLTYLNSIQLDQELRHRTITSLPIFDFLFDQIKTKGVDITSQHLVLQKELEALDHQFHWSKDVSLGAQVRYNYYHGGVTSSYVGRDFLSAGLSLSVPIPFNKSANRTWKEAKKQRFKTEFETFQNGLNNELLNHYYEYEYAHKQYLNFFYKKERLAVAVDRHIRKRNLSDPDYSPMQVVDKLDELFSVDLELIDIQQKMYLKALRIFTMIDAPDILPYIELKDYNAFVSQYNSRREIFCSVADLKNYESSFLIEFFKMNGIKEVMAAGAQDPDTYLKYAELLDGSVGTELEIRFLIDPFNSRSELGEQHALLQLALTPLIHFDLSTISPNYRNQHFDEILEILTSSAGLYDISLAVPIDLDISILQSLLPFISKLHLVPPESHQLTGQYLNLVLDLQARYGNKLNIVVRPEDFGTKLEMDQFIRQLTEQLDLKSLTLSSMSQLIALDKKMVGWHEERRF